MQIVLAPNQSQSLKSPLDLSQSEELCVVPQKTGPQMCLYSQCIFNMYRPSSMLKETVHSKNKNFVVIYSPIMSFHVDFFILWNTKKYILKDVSNVFDHTVKCKLIIYLSVYLYISDILKFGYIVHLLLYLHTYRHIKQQILPDFLYFGTKCNYIIFQLFI